LTGWSEPRVLFLSMHPVLLLILSILSLYPEQGRDIFDRVNRIDGMVGAKSSVSNSYILFILLILSILFLYPSKAETF